MSIQDVINMRRAEAVPVRKATVADRVADLREQISVEKAQMATEALQHEQWRNEFIEDAHRTADNQDWCGVFDEGMEEAGLPTRENTLHSVSWAVEYRLTRTITLDDLVDEIEGAVGEGVPSYESTDSNEMEVEDADHVVTVHRTILISGVYEEIDHQSCVCEDVDTAFDEEWTVTVDGRICDQCTGHGTKAR